MHIVVGKSDVLRRHAQYLADAFGWTIGETPDPSAEGNIFIPYLMWQGFDKTPCYGWFTHYDKGNPKKAALWGGAAASMVSASQAPLYMDSLDDSVWIPGAVDLEHFTVRRRRKKDDLLVGVCGMVYSGGRKGESLIKNLEYNVIASGQGWPCPCKWRDWDAMPGFYNSLDVFLCTSTVEGGPLPVLEALACGIPVVIPRHVGMLDELPDMPGIVRYDVDINKAIKEALSKRVVRKNLRAVAEAYSIDRWCQSWTDLVGHKETIIEGTKGVYIVAYGGPARKMAERCIKSIQEHMPDLEIALAADSPLGMGETYLEIPDLDIGGRSVKTQIYELAPKWEYVLYLDADTEVVADISFLFDLLEDGWDMSICINPDKYHIARNMVRPDNKDECEETFKECGTDELIQLQGGMFSFKRNYRTATLFRSWHNEWQRWGKRDQGALLRAMHKHPVKLYMLGNEWNTSTRYFPNYMERTAGILHHQMTARRWEGLIKGRLDSKEAWKAVKE